MAKKEYYKCACCGNLKHISEMHIMDAVSLGDNPRRVCDDCFKVKGYCTKNNAINHKGAKHGLTFGCELECIPYSLESQAAFASPYYGFIPTEDCSISYYGGIEYKSPVWRNLSGLRQMFRSLNQYADFGHKSCGQHIHVGHENYNSWYTRRYAHELFGQVTEWAGNHPLEIAALFGRASSPDYAMFEVYQGNRYSWINLANDYTIEFRLCKFVNPDQYFSLFCMSGEIMEIVIESQKREIDSRKAGQKILKIVQKYAEGRAQCQIRAKGKRA